MMCQSVGKDRFLSARNKNGNVPFLEEIMRTYWLNWLKNRSNNDRNMCACETCQTMNDLHVAYIAKRRKLIARTKAQLKEMPGRSQADQKVKFALEKKFKKHKDATFV